MIFSPRSYQSALIGIAASQNPQRGRPSPYSKVSEAAKHHGQQSSPPRCSGGARFVFALGRGCISGFVAAVVAGKRGLVHGSLRKQLPGRLARALAPPTDSAQAACGRPWCNRVGELGVVATNSALHWSGSVETSPARARRASHFVSISSRRSSVRSFNSRATVRASSGEVTLLSLRQLEFTRSLRRSGSAWLTSNETLIAS
jgi:hypothetical protein